MKPFKLINYDTPFSWNVSHNGHTGIFWWKKIISIIKYNIFHLVVVNRLDGLNQEVAVEGSDFDSRFNLLQFHFHWGYNNFQG